ncbi:MAG: hypothetical protein Q8P39_01905 [Candidatus Yanofskybacteria bacterium]|nr:hypothetical protein [Candidatus Yanofskybacteria bacterium]
MNRFDATADFEKEFKRLFKKYKTLDDDFEKFKKILVTAPAGVGRNFVIIHSAENIKVLKARMACRTLRDRSLRVVYSYFEQEQRIEFIELYFKGDKETEDHGRVKEYLSNHQN